MKALVFLEHNHHQLFPTSFSVVSAASKITNEITACVIGTNCEAVARESALLPVKEVIYVDSPCYQDLLAENLAASLREIARGFTHILAAATAFGKNLMPRVAALLGVPQLSEITAIISPNTYVRPIYAGNAFATLQNDAPIQVLTVRGIAFTPVKAGNIPAPIQKRELAVPVSSARFVSRESAATERPDLGVAKVVISGGRGLQSKENFKLLDALADKLHAAIGASRAAVDAGFAPNDWQVGQTGRVVAPQLYIAVGISGAIQHVAGIKDSKVIVAINKDPDAPIFQVADYGLVGDLFEILPKLLQSLD